MRHPARERRGGRHGRHAFSWDRARGWMDGLPEGRGLNIAHEAVDRHARGGRADHVAIRWLGKDGTQRDVPYGELRDLTNRFAGCWAASSGAPRRRAPRHHPPGGLVVRGRPALSISVTHTRGLVVVAVAEGVRVGVDAERVDRTHLPAPQLWTTPDELARLPAPTDAQRRAALLELWTCKEAVAKALGTGLSTPLRAIAVRDGHVTTSSQPEGTWRLVSLAVPSTHVATLVVWEGDPPRQ